MLDSGSGVPSWLTAMQGDDGWRRMLIELAKEHKGSALLRFVLKQLSDRGHHREIAAVISETDLFSVFNGKICVGDLLPYVLCFLFTLFVFEGERGGTCCIGYRTLCVSYNMSRGKDMGNEP